MENKKEQEKNREIVSQRIVQSPRELVWKAWTQPQHLAKWWGPNGFTNTFHAFELKPGGKWDFTMHGPDRTDYRNTCAFVEIVKPERIIFDHIEPIHQFRVTASFDDLGGKTKITFRMLFELASEYEKVKTFVVDANEQNFDRLEQELNKMSN